MTGFLRRGALVPALALLTACNGFSVHYDFDRSAGFAGYKTFEWFQPGPGGPKPAVPENPIMDRRVRRIVEQELAAKGLRREPGGEPDLKLACYPVYRNRVVQTYSGMGPGWGWGWGMRPWGYGPAFGFQETRSYREGTIVLEMVDARSSQMVWQGAAEGALTGLRDPQDAEEQVTAAVRKLLEKFPPPAGR